MELEGKGQVEGLFADRTVGLDGVRTDIAMMRTPDGHGQLELTMYHTPAAVGAEPENPPPNTLGLHRVMFAVDDINDTVARLRAHGAELLGAGGTVREQLPALLSPRPRGHHRRPGRTDRLRRACCGTRPRAVRHRLTGSRAGGSGRRLLPVRLRLELQRDRVDAEAIPRRPRSVGEHMPQMAAASRTGDLRAMHPEGPVVVQLDGPGLDRLPETRPTGPRLVLGR